MYIYARAVYSADGNRGSQTLYRTNYRYLGENETSAERRRRHQRQRDGSVDDTGVRDPLCPSRSLLSLSASVRTRQAQARLEPIKAESRKHVVNRPHFAATPWRISRYLSF